MKKTAFVLFAILFFSVFTPLVKADGIPYPPIRPDVREEHQIVLVEVVNDQIVTTLDLGIRNVPKTVFPLLENSIYISESNPVWLKTFLLPSDFRPKGLCINSYGLRHEYEDKPLVKVTINENVVYLYTKQTTSLASPAEMIKPIIYPRYGQTYCQFISNENMSDPQFVDVSKYFTPGQYNTVAVRSNIEYRSFSVNRVYLQSTKTTDVVKIIIPFKAMPKSIEVGGYGLNIWQLDEPFREKKYWYGYYGGRLLSAQEAPALAGKAEMVETGIKSQVAQTSVATDVSAGFEGKVSDLIGESGESSLSTRSNLPKLPKGVKVIRFADNPKSLYEGYLQDNAYVLELKIKPYELKRVTIKWVEGIADKNNFPYYYPLGTAKTWAENINYTAIYVKLPKEYAINYFNIEGKEEAYDDNYNYYRWKFVDSKPAEDFHINVGKLSWLEEILHRTSVWFTRHSAIIGIVALLIIIGMAIQFKFKRKRRSRIWAWAIQQGQFIRQSQLLKG